MNSPSGNGPHGDAGPVGDFELFTTRSGLKVYLLRTSKFKTKLVRIHLRAPLGPECCARSLVPNLLRRGCRSHPTMVGVSRALEHHYGSSWNTSIYKLGNDQILSYRTDFVDEEYLPGRPDLERPVLELSRELLQEPVLEGSLFPADSFAQERTNLRHEIEAQYNDKMVHASQRLMDEMFPDLPYSVPVLGKIEDVDQLTAESVTATWREMVERMPAQVFAVGNFEPESIIEWAENSLTNRSGPSKCLRTTEAPAETETRTVVESEAISQSKLLIGCHVDLTELDRRQFDALRVYSSILGGGFHSRLFRSIREQHSLAYYASAALDRVQGVLFMSFGIDASNRERVLELCGQEMDSLRKEPPRADEMEQTLQILSNTMRSMLDAPNVMVEALEGGLASGYIRPVRTVAEEFRAVTREDVQRVARRIQPPAVVYCLEGTA